VSIIKMFGEDGAYVEKLSREINGVVITDVEGDFIYVWRKDEVEDLIKCLQECIDEGWVES